MKILLIGERYSSNLGDGVICEIVEAQLQKLYPKAIIKAVDISGRLGYQTESKRIEKMNEDIRKIIKHILHGIGLGKYISQAKHKKYIKDICRESYDIAIFAGGHLLKDTFILPIIDFINYLSLDNTPIVFNACGAGKIKDSTQEKMLTKALNSPNVAAISIRDNVEIVNSIYLKGSKLRAVPTYDPGIWSKDVYSVSKSNSEIIGLGIMLVPHIEKDILIHFWNDVIFLLNEKNIQWKMFCNGTVDDYEFAKSILLDIGYPRHKIELLLVKRPEKPKDLVKSISEFKSILSFRLHSHIIAYSLDIPSIAIVWNEKVKFFFDSIGFSNRCKSLGENCIEIVKSLEEAQKENYNRKLRAEHKQHNLSTLILHVEKSIKN